MALTRYPGRLGRAVSPWAELDRLANRMNRLMGDTDTGDLTYGGAWLPAVNVEERENEILLTAELPGISQDDIEIEIENNVLTVSGEKRDQREEESNGNRYHLVERTFGSFRRSFTLPRTVDADKINASFESGVLSVRLPKAEESLTRRIKIGKKSAAKV